MARCSILTSIYYGSNRIPNFFDIDGLVHHEFVPPGRRVCYWPFVCASFAEVAPCSSEEAVRQVADRDSGVCITITHRVTHRVVQQYLAQKTLPVITQTLYSPDLAPSRFWLSILWKLASRGLISQPWRTWNRMRRPNFVRFQMKPPAGATKNSRIDGTSACTCKGPTLKVIRWALPLCPTIAVQYHHSGTFLTAHRICHWVVGWSLNNELEMLWNEAVVA
jgi:hypothetical protein